MKYLPLLLVLLVFSSTVSASQENLKLTFTKMDLTGVFIGPRGESAQFIVRGTTIDGRFEHTWQLKGLLEGFNQRCIDKFESLNLQQLTTPSRLVVLIKDPPLATETISGTGSQKERTILLSKVEFEACYTYSE